MRATTRGRFLRRLGLLAGATAAAAVPASAAQGASPSGSTLLLTVHDVSGLAEGRRFGQLPQPGDRTVVHGVLRDARGRRAGDLHITGHHPASGGRGIEQHVLALPGGMLLGIGIGGGDEFAIVGGTGAYAKARGSYRAHVSPQGLAGDGTGRFDIRFEI